MKLKELKNCNFNIHQGIDINTDLIFFDYGEKDINELLTQYVKTPNIFLNKIQLKALKELNDEYQLMEEVINNFYNVLFDTLQDKEKEDLIGLSLEINRPFMCVLLSNPNIKLTPEQFDKIFNIDTKEIFNLHNNYSHKDITFMINMKISLIQNHNIFLSAEQIYDDFFDKYSKFKDAYSKRSGISTVPFLIDKMIEHENIFDDSVFENILTDKNLQLTEKQVDYFLDNGSFFKRYLLSVNPNINYTYEQIIKGLDDKGYSDSEYENEIHCLYDLESYAISDNFYHIADKFFTNPEITMDVNSITKILKDTNSNKHIVECLKRREDIKNSITLTELILSTAEYTQNKMGM